VRNDPSNPSASLQTTSQSSEQARHAVANDTSCVRVRHAHDRMFEAQALAQPRAASHLTDSSRCGAICGDAYRRYMRLQCLPHVCMRKTRTLESHSAFALECVNHRADLPLSQTATCFAPRSANRNVGEELRVHRDAYKMSFSRSNTEARRQKLSLPSSFAYRKSLPRSKAP